MTTSKYIYVYTIVYTILFEFENETIVLKTPNDLELHLQYVYTLRGQGRFRIALVYFDRIESVRRRSDSNGTV